MNIGLDWDGTVTTDPNTWVKVVQTLNAAEFRVHIVTMRFQSEVDRDPMMQRFRPFVVDIHATGRHAKEAFMEAKNIPIHIWIDDNPRAIYMSAMQIWGTSTPEGHVIDTNLKVLSNVTDAEDNQ